MLDFLKKKAVMQLSRHKISDAGAEKFIAVLQCNETLMFLGFMHN